MDEYTKAKADISQAIETLGLAHCLAFAATCCERLVPNYHAFSKVHNWGDPAPLNEALEMIWDSLKTRVAHYDETNLLLNSMEEIAPNLDRFNSIYVWQAIYAIEAVSTLLRYHLSPEKQHIVHVSGVSIDAIYHYVQDVVFPLNVLAIPPHQTNEHYLLVFTTPIFVTELADQRKTLEALRTQNDLSADFLDHLRDTGQKSGINPIRRGLVVTET